MRHRRLTLFALIGGGGGGDGKFAKVASLELSNSVP